MSKITRELATPPRAALPLDPSIFKPKTVELDFLRIAISTDDEVIRRRVFQVQQEAYEEYPYPCIRSFHFVQFKMSANSIYPSIIEAGLQMDTMLLDLGCCMGSDLRKLVHDGYPSANVIGCDLRPSYITLGHKLYADADTCPIAFFTSDIFDIPITHDTGNNTADSDSPTPGITDLKAIFNLDQLRGRLTHVYVGALFHLFDEETQEALALRTALLLRREKGAVVFGRHQGQEVEGIIDDPMGRVRYGHSPQSWRRLWVHIFTELEGQEFGNRVVVEATLEKSGMEGMAPSHSWMFWSVSIV